MIQYNKNKGMIIGLLNKLLFAVLFTCSHLVMAHGDGKLSDPDHPDIRIVMSGAFVSESGIGVYDEIANYLGKKLNHQVSFVSGFSYSTINAMLDSGTADIGFVCGLPYVLKRDQTEPMIDVLLAPVSKAPQYKNKPIYYSYLIVNKDSKAESFADLRGMTFVYNDEISNSGYNMPRAHLMEQGETRGFFGQVIRSGSHEESIRMVANGLADISAVDSLVYDYDLEKYPEFVQQTRILEILGPSATPPIVVSKKLSVELREKIRDVFSGMNSDPEGRGILDAALLDRFEIINDSDYDSVRKMYKQAQDTGYMVIR
ncbi:MAG: phosphate/phosphite/phosphonate ABC transporter substrate-binding protein [Gammaproteobacteria bacterium]|nr:phosphate/phosphite/phosphonate ABC transporter substrate-binding protein [Gammaproteobacteria bacterium]